MSETPVNLNKVRKARARAADKVRADTNAVTFGRSKAERAADQRETLRMTRDLDGKILKTPEHGSDKGNKTP